MLEYPGKPRLRCTHALMAERFYLGRSDDHGVQQRAQKCDFGTHSWAERGSIRPRTRTAVHMMYGFRSTMCKLRGQENVFKIGLGLLRLDTGELPAEAEEVLIRRDSGARRCLTPSRQALGHA